MVARDQDGRQHDDGVDRRQHARQAVRGEQKDRQREEQRVADVEAGQGGVLVGDKGQDAAVVVARRVQVERVDHARGRHQAGRRHRQQGEDRHRQQVHGEEHVAKEDEGLVAIQVDPHEDEDRRRQVDAAVEPVHELDQHVHVAGHRLDPGLDVQVQGFLGVDDALGVGHGHRLASAHHDATRARS